MFLRWQSVLVSHKGCISVFNAPKSEKLWVNDSSHPLCHLYSPAGLRDATQERP